MSSKALPLPRSRRVTRVNPRWRWGAQASALALMACLHTPTPEHAATTPPLSTTEATAFFDRYARLLRAADPALIALYDDDAKIETIRHEGKTTKAVEVPGKTWKGLLAELLPVLRSSGESIVFSNVAVAQQGEFMRVTAHRYTLSRCSDDHDYYVDLRRNQAGALRIAGEFLHIVSESQCGIGPGKSLDQRLDELAGQIAHALPIRLDPDTRLDAVRRGQSELRYELTLVSLLDVSRVDLPKLSTLLRQQALQTACKKQTALRAVLDDGGRVSYRYADPSGQALVNVTVDTASCPGG